MTFQINDGRTTQIYRTDADDALGYVISKVIYKTKKNETSYEVGDFVNIGRLIKGTKIQRTGEILSFDGLGYALIKHLENNKEFEEYFHLEQLEKIPNSLHYFTEEAWN